MQPRSDPGQPPFGNALSLGSTRTDSAGIATIPMPRSPHAFLRIDPPLGHLPVVVAATSCPATVTMPTVWMLRGAIDPPCPSAPTSIAALTATQCSLRARHLDGGSASPEFASTALHGGRYTIVGLRPGRHQLDYVEMESGRCRVWSLGEVAVHGDTRFDLLRTLPRAAVRARVHGVDATSTFLDIVRDSGEVAAQFVPVRDGVAEFEITPGSYEVRIRRLHAGYRLPYSVKAEGRFAWDGSEAPTWEITFRDEPGELIVVGAAGQPLARRWFAIASHLCLLPSDAAGRIALPTWPGDEFTIRRATLVDGIWQHGPAAKVVRGQRQVVVPER